MSLCCKVLQALEGRTLCTAESCTGGGIGEAVTAIPGSSSVYKGGIISYTNDVKEKLLGVPADTLSQFGAVSRQTALAMARGARQILSADVAVSVTGLAGPGGDDFGNPVGTVYIGYSDPFRDDVKAYCFSGDRESVRQQAMFAALELILEYS